MVGAIHANATKQGPPQASCYTLASLPLGSTCSAKSGSGRPISQSLSWNFQVRDKQRWSGPHNVHPSRWGAGAGFRDRPLCTSPPSAPLTACLGSVKPTVVGVVAPWKSSDPAAQGTFFFLRAIVKHVPHTSCPLLISSLQMVVGCGGKVAFLRCGQAPSRSG